MSEGTHLDGKVAALGRSVFGPILAEFSLRLFLFLASVRAPEDTVLLFCTRGGLRLKLAYERFLAAVGFASPVVVDDLMVSRLIAARAALIRRAPAAFEEIGFEFKDDTLSNAILALASADVPIAPEWHGPYSDQAFRAFLDSSGADATTFWSALREQSRLFELHLRSRSRGRGQIVICDTGLSGSTLRLLQAGFPEARFRCLLFARRGYKRLPTSHFSDVVGLSIEQDRYVPGNGRTVVLRYWHLVEWLLEPRIPSVRTFMLNPATGDVVSNLEVEGWRERVAQGRPMFTGALAYIDGLRARPFLPGLVRDRDAAWRRLAMMVARPSMEDVRLLAIEDRSSDFGRDGMGKAFVAAPGSFPARLRLVLRGGFWREADIVRAFGPWRIVLQRALATAYVADWFRRTYLPAIRGRLRRLRRSRPEAPRNPDG